MTGSLSDRHSGTLDGRLRELGQGAITVGVFIEPDSAARVATQHTAWMLVNLLARLKGVVVEVRLGGGDGVLGGRVIPLSGLHRLQAALLERGNAIGGVPISPGSVAGSDVLLLVGPGAAPSAGWRVYGEGFCGAFSRCAIPSAADSPLPFGPYIAACLAAGEIFRAVRLPASDYERIDRLSYSAWDYTKGHGDLHAVGPRVGPVALDLGLAGVGAVGCTLVHALWACPELRGSVVLADSDRKGIDVSNLNRYVLFGRQHIGAPKATTAAELCGGSLIRWTPVDGPFSRANISSVPACLASAVDTNRSRDQLQQGFWPGSLLGASTKDLRAEVLIAGPPGVGPCLRCHNPPEVDLPDEVVRAELRNVPDADLRRLAKEIGQPFHLVERWRREGGCGEVGDAVLAHARTPDGEDATFSVGFVSVLAGTLLAAEVLKQHASAPGALNDRFQRAKFQFLRPAAARNGHARPELRDPYCPVCDPDGPGVATWRARADHWAASRVDDTCDTSP